MVKNTVRGPPAKRLRQRLKGYLFFVLTVGTRRVP